jgi:hypothetical protein
VRRPTVVASHARTASPRLPPAVSTKLPPTPAPAPAAAAATEAAPAPAAAYPAAVTTAAATGEEANVVRDTASTARAPRVAEQATPRMLRTGAWGGELVHAVTSPLCSAAGLHLKGKL